MKHFIKKLLIVFSVILFIYSCTNTEIATWNTEVVPVVFSVITPLHPVQVYLGKSYTESDTTNASRYPEAKVYICGPDSAWVELKRRTNDSAIFVDSIAPLKIIIGNTYSLRIELKGKTVHAQTTVPGDPGIITGEECRVLSNKAGGSVNGTHYTDKLCALHVTYTLPSSSGYGCYLSAFKNKLGKSPFLSGNNFQEESLLVPTDDSSFLLNITTVDPGLKKFLMAQVASSDMFDSADFTEILATYGGVRPAFSNIQNGIGLFGSFVINTKQIMVTPLSE